MKLFPIILLNAYMLSACSTEQAQVKNTVQR